eukprot:COSAG01_NODE_24_length_37608_cov_19.303154_5_plen_207_part_00
MSGALSILDALHVGWDLPMARLFSSRNIEDGLASGRLFRLARLVEFVAGAWGEQRYRARLFGVVVRRPLRPFWRAGLTEIYLRNVCSCPEILRRNGRGQSEGEHGPALLRHLVALAHDEARLRGFLGMVSCTVGEAGAATDAALPPRANRVPQLMVAKDLHTSSRRSSSVWADQSLTAEQWGLSQEHPAGVQASTVFNDPRDFVLR